MSPLAKQEKDKLLKLAREAIVRKVVEGSEAMQAVEDPALRSPSGAFVTLHLGDQLRGCIGRVRSDEALGEVVQEMAVAAATRDPRFAPVQSDEIDKLRLEISVMTPPVVCEDTDQIEVGVHGLIVSSAWNSGLLLPQVATEWGWDREEFLNHTCLKAGLPEDFWRNGSPKIEVFSAEVFSEEK